MAAHSFWKFGELWAGASPPGNGLSAAEWHLRQTVGGSDEVPTSSSASTQGFGAITLAYDNNPATCWASNSGDTAHTGFVAFGFAAPINLVQFWIQARQDSGFQQQTPYQGNVYYSDTAITGPWTLSGSFDVGPFTTTGQIKFYSLAPQAIISEQSVMLAMIAGSAPGEAVISAQSEMLAMLPIPGVSLTEQSVMLAMLMNSIPPETQRRQYFIT